MSEYLTQNFIRIIDNDELLQRKLLNLVEWCLNERAEARRLESDEVLTFDEAWLAATEEVITMAFEIKAEAYEARMPGNSNIPEEQALEKRWSYLLTSMMRSAIYAVDYREVAQHFITKLKEQDAFKKLESYPAKSSEAS